MKCEKCGQEIEQGTWILTVNTDLEVKMCFKCASKKVKEWTEREAKS
jgi:ribosomal protein L24E